jgi:hypothetical protein
VLRLVLLAFHFDAIHVNPPKDHGRRLLALADAPTEFVDLPDGRPVRQGVALGREQPDVDAAIRLFLYEVARRSDAPLRLVAMGLMPCSSFSIIRSVMML